MSKHLFAVCFFLLSFNTAAVLPVIEDSDSTPSTAVTGRDGTAALTAGIALVVGNDDYRDGPLRTPLPDARAIARLLENKGFEVVLLENPGREILQQALRDLHSGRAPTTTRLFYFAGHGVHTGESVLLLPVDADATSPAALQQTALGLEQVVALMAAGRHGDRNLVIIDTCLNNPYAHRDPGGGSGASGLPGLPDQTLIAFATAPGGVAYDGAGQTGIYAQALLDALQQPGLDVDSVFARVSRAVRSRTGDRQRPWILTTLESPPALHTGMATRDADASLPSPDVLSSAQLAAMATRGILPQDSDAQYELEFWQSIKDSTDASDYEAYLEAFPDGKFAPLAKARAKRYKKAPAEPAYVVNDMQKALETVSNANVRETPSASSRRLGEIPRGRKVEVTGQLADKKWYRVRFGETSGYVFAQLLRPPAPEPKPEPKPARKSKPVTTAAVARPVAPTRPVQLEAVREFQDCSSCPILLALPSGSFTMGEKRGHRSEQPARRVSIAEEFAIGKYEVTVAQWNACVRAGACSYRPDLDAPDENSPIRDVSWSDAQEYVAWLSKLTGKPYRLPTEAEWEYAARGGTGTRFWWGNDVGVGKADCKNCGGQWNKQAPAAVDSFPANPLGLHGTSGGVWEWVADCWHKTYRGAPADSRAWTERDCRENVIRGGAWRNDAGYIHSASRFKYDTHVRYLMNGFRVARTLP